MCDFVCRTFRFEYSSISFHKGRAFPLSSSVIIFLVVAIFSSFLRLVNDTAVSRVAATSKTEKDRLSRLEVVLIVSNHGREHVWPG